MRRTILTVLVLLALAGVSRAQAPASDPGSGKLPSAPRSTDPAAPAIEPVGVESGLDSEVSIGDEAPDFTMDGSQGHPVRLSDLEGQWAVMVFADDRTTLGRLGGIDGVLRGLGARLYGVCRDGAQALESYARRETIPFVILSDPTGQISQVYGMYDSDDDDIQPGVVVLDPRGVVRMAVLGPALHADEILQLARHAMIGA
jgi:thioredoxin-dependent peroxiredoxin